MENYNRQILYFGKENQEKLKKARVLVVGVGGLGSIVLYYLTAAGIGYIRAIDKDIVDITNLNRQILHYFEDIGKDKIESVSKLKKLNPEVEFDFKKIELNKDNVDDFIKDVDIVVDCLDNVETRLILNDACLKNNKVLVYGSVEGMKGMQMTVVGEENSLRKIYKEKDPAVFPILGGTAGVLGSIQSLEVIKYFIKEKLNTKLLVFDISKNSFRYLEV